MSLKRVKKRVFHYDTFLEGSLRSGPHLLVLLNLRKAKGNVTNLKGVGLKLRGDLSGLRGVIAGQVEGDASKVRGDVTFLVGDLSGLRGDCSQIKGFIGGGSLAAAAAAGIGAFAGGNALLGAVAGAVAGFIKDKKALTGDCTRIRGDVTLIHGDCSNITGDVSFIMGDVSKLKGEILKGLVGDVTSLSGDVSRLRGPTMNVRGDCTNIYGSFHMPLPKLPDGVGGVFDAVAEAVLAVSSDQFDQLRAGVKAACGAFADSASALMDAGAAARASFLSSSEVFAGDADVARLWWPATAGQYVMWRSSVAAFYEQTCNSLQIANEFPLILGRCQAVSDTWYSLSLALAADYLPVGSDPHDPRNHPSVIAALQAVDTAVKALLDNSAFPVSGVAAQMLNVPSKAWFKKTDFYEHKVFIAGGSAGAKAVLRASAASAEAALASAEALEDAVSSWAGNLASASADARAAAKSLSADARHASLDAAHKWGMVDMHQYLASPDPAAFTQFSSSWALKVNAAVNASATVQTATIDFESFTAGIPDRVADPYWGAKALSKAQALRDAALSQLSLHRDAGDTILGDGAFDLFSVSDVLAVKSAGQSILTVAESLYSELLISLGANWVTQPTWTALKTALYDFLLAVGAGWPTLTALNPAFTSASLSGSLIAGSLPTDDPLADSAKRLQYGGLLVSDVQSYLSDMTTAQSNAVLAMASAKTKASSKEIADQMLASIVADWTAAQSATRAIGTSAAAAMSKGNTTQDEVSALGTAYAAAFSNSSADGIPGQYQIIKEFKSLCSTPYAPSSADAAVCLAVIDDITSEVDRIKEAMSGNGNPLDTSFYGLIRNANFVLDAQDLLKIMPHDRLAEASERSTRADRLFAVAAQVFPSQGPDPDLTAALQAAIIAAKSVSLISLSIDGLLQASSVTPSVARGPIGPDDPGAPLPIEPFRAPILSGNTAARALYGSLSVTVPPSPGFFPTSWTGLIGVLDTEGFKSAESGRLALSSMDKASADALEAGKATEKSAWAAWSLAAYGDLNPLTLLSSFGTVNAALGGANTMASALKVAASAVIAEAKHSATGGISNGDAAQATAEAKSSFISEASAYAAAAAQVQAAADGVGQAISSGADLSAVLGAVTTAIRGDVSALSGDISGLYGDVSGLSGLATGLAGDCSELEGDMGDIALKRRLLPGNGDVDVWVEAGVEVK
jgi:hypothetical protein